MTALDVPAIRALLAGVTPGPRDVNDDGEIFDADFCLVVGTKWPHGAPTRQLKLDPADAAFIAAAPSIVAQLLGVVERVEGLAEYLDGLAPDDQHYARCIRAALTEEGQ